VFLIPYCGLLNIRCIHYFDSAYFGLQNIRYIHYFDSAYSRLRNIRCSQFFFNRVYCGPRNIRYIYRFVLIIADSKGNLHVIATRCTPNGNAIPTTSHTPTNAMHIFPRMSDTAGSSTHPTFCLARTQQRNLGASVAQLTVFSWW
jgi:hypothetical protein